MCKMGGIGGIAYDALGVRRVGVNSLVQSSGNVRTTHTGGLRKGSMGGRRMKELWPSLTTVEPATIYPPEEGRGVDFAGHKRGGMKGDVCVHVKGPRTRWVCKVVAVAGREGEPHNQLQRSKGPPSLYVGNEYSLLGAVKRKEYCWKQSSW